ncbi:urease accessory UreF family protein [Sedimentitalea sp. JM2-8]|uniref:Urease accessory protein UreF n=1 Tax=Sedimentitalea xiamensis TaxID=3050037 RepID=A0ABT7FCR9_9RHOB|nr:urease accessory UreF family protein [Sedimentitalea xiamensis]MDK3072904.1 urease accessory UreF family protein [Sedimentitalea xiamensis]
MDQTEMNIPLALVRLTSSLLPVGAFAYSRGLEHAANVGWVTDAQDLRSWLFGTLQHSYASLDGAMFLRLMAAAQECRWQDFQRDDVLLCAARESRELQQEDMRMAEALMDLLREMGVAAAQDQSVPCKTFPAAFALAAHDAGASASAGLAGLMWSLCEAQVAAAIRLGIIGQTDGQKILADAPSEISRALVLAEETPADEIGNLSFLQAVGSALHERQYSRLFRS